LVSTGLCTAGLGIGLDLGPAGLGLGLGLDTVCLGLGLDLGLGRPGLDNIICHKSNHPQLLKLGDRGFKKSLI
jgi:hypothetical protein